MVDCKFEVAYNQFGFEHLIKLNYASAEFKRKIRFTFINLEHYINLTGSIGGGYICGTLVIIGGGRLFGKEDIIFAQYLVVRKAKIKYSELQYPHSHAIYRCFGYAYLLSPILSFKMAILNYDFDD